MGLNLETWELGRNILGVKRGFSESEKKANMLRIQFVDTVCLA